MKITNLNLNKNINIDDKVLREGVAIQAKIMEVNGSNIIIMLDNGELLEAKTLLDMENLKNQLVKFLIKNIEDGKVFLTPINKEDLNLIKGEGYSDNKAVDVFIDKVLNTYNLIKNEENILLIKTIIGNKMPLTKENLDNLIKNIEKLKNLINIQKDEKVFAINLDKTPFDESIMKFIKINNNTITENNAGIYPHSDNNLPINENIANIKQNNYQGQREVVDVTKDIFPKLESIFSQDTSTRSLINKVVILTQLGVELSLNNIEKLKNFIENGEGIIRPLLKLASFIKNSEQTDDRYTDESNDFSNKLDLKFVKVDEKNTISKESIRRFLYETKEILERLTPYIKSKKSLSKELSIRINNFLDNLDLQRKINSYYTFVHIPIEYEEEKDENNLFIIKKKNKLYTNSYSIYISLNTKNLNKVDVYCNINDEEIKADFIIEKEFRNLFKDEFDRLKGSLNKLGYKNVSINLREDFEKDLLNVFLENDLFNYNLNIRV